MHTLCAGIGVDLIHIDKIERLKPEVREKVFTKAELEYSERSPKHYLERLAARFAVKEAVLKALGTGWTGQMLWTDIEVISEISGAPKIRLSGEVQNIFLQSGAKDILVSMSHDSGFAVAMVALV